MKPLFIDLPEEIKTSHLKLVMPRAGYGATLHAALMDGYEDYVKWLGWPATPPSVEQAEADCRTHHADFILRNFIRYLILETESGDIVGRCALPSFQANWAIPQFGISYFIRKSARGKGYATEAAYALACLSFDVLKARKVEIHTDVENTASAEVPKKLGFELEYTQKGGWPRPDNALATLQTFSCFSKDALPKMSVEYN